MFKKIKHALRIYLILLLVALLEVTACRKADKSQLGVDIPTDIKPSRLQEVLQNPHEFNGKKVVMKGIVSGQCPSLCEFFFKDGPYTATIFPQGFKFPRLETGRAVTVYAQVTSGAEQVVFSALGLRFERGTR